MKRRAVAAPMPVAAPVIKTERIVGITGGLWLLSAVTAPGAHLAAAPAAGAALVQGGALRGAAGAGGRPAVGGRAARLVGSIGGAAGAEAQDHGAAAAALADRALLGGAHGGMVVGEPVLVALVAVDGERAVGEGGALEGEGEHCGDAELLEYLALHVLFSFWLAPGSGRRELCVHPCPGPAKQRSEIV